MLQVFIHERSNEDEHWNKERKNCIPHALILISQNECASVSGKLSEGENRMKNPIFMLWFLIWSLLDSLVAFAGSVLIPHVFLVYFLFSVCALQRVDSLDTR